MLEEEKEKKEKYRSIFNMLPEGLKAACKEWSRQEGGWDETAWMETLEALIGMFSDYQQAEQWVRNEVLKKS